MQIAAIKNKSRVAFLIFILLIRNDVFDSVVAANPAQLFQRASIPVQAL